MLITHIWGYSLTLSLLFCLISQCGAVEFIKKLTPASLGLTKAEFEKLMHDGIPVTLCPADIPDALADVKQRYSAISQK